MNFVVEAVLSGVMSVLSALLVYYLLQKKAEKTVNFYKNQLKTEVEGWLNSETGAKALYGVGMMLGQGAKQSIGIGTKGGKMKWTDLLAQIGINWAQKNLNLGNLGQTGPGQLLNSKSLNKKSVLGSA